MKILYIHQYFRTPQEGGCTRSFELAKGLVAHGFEVVMLTTHNQLRGVHKIDGIKVHYLRIHYKNQFGFLKRINAFLRFVQLAKREVKNIHAVDLAYVMTTPLTTGLIALHLKNRHQIPFYFEVGDLWPEAPVQMKAIRNAWLMKKLYRFEKLCYQKASKVIALSPAIESYIKEVTPETTTHVISNMADCAFFQDSSSHESKIFNIGYFGALGKANDLSQLIHLAKVCEKKSIPVTFTVMGEGAEEAYLKLEAEKLKNTELIPFGNKAEVKSQIVKMDAVYISYKNLPVLTTGSPNKLFDGLAAGKLIITNFGGWIKQLIEKNQCGFSYDGSNPVEFIEKINPFLTDAALLKAAQKNSRKLAESEFDKQLLIDRLVSTIEKKD